MGEVLQSGEAGRRTNLVPEHRWTLKREVPIHPVRRYFKDHIYSELNLALLRTIRKAQRPRRLMDRVAPTEAKP